MQRGQHEIFVRSSLQKKFRQKGAYTSHVYNLRWCDIEAHKMKAIIETITDIEAQKDQSEHSVVEIDLFQNKISDMGCKALSQLLSQNLQTLILSSNYITDKGCRYLMCGQWKQLTTLLLKSNRISNRGCEYLSKVNSKKLTHLNLSDNKINVEGCRILMKIFSSNLNLQLYNNKMSREIYKQLINRGWSIICEEKYTKDPQTTAIPFDFDS